jgi:nicotinamide mononucleotide transporter
MTWMDWIGFVTGAACVFLIVIEKDVNWPIGILNSLALLVVFWRQRLFAQVGLQAFYVGEGIYGWWMWTRRDRQTGLKLMRIGTTQAQTHIRLSLIAVAGVLVLHPVFSRTGDPAPFWDSVITVLSLVAEYMLCLKLLEAWGVYLAADLISLCVLALLGMWVTFGTYLCFTVLCVMGILEWRRRMRNASGRALSLASSTP